MPVGIFPLTFRQFFWRERQFTSISPTIHTTFMKVRQGQRIMNEAPVPTTSITTMNRDPDTFRQRVLTNLLIGLVTAVVGPAVLVAGLLTVCANMQNPALAPKVVATR